MEKNASGKSQKVYTNVNCKKERLQDYSNQMQLEASIMVIRVVEFSSGGYKIRKNFALHRINIPKGNHWILTIGVMGSCQKLGIILLIKCFKN